MSVPATKACPPAPRSVATRTEPSAARRSQIATSASYIGHVIALRAAGRSNTMAATPSARLRRTSPSSVAIGKGSCLGQPLARRRIDAELVEQLGSVLAEQRRMAPHLLRRAGELHRKADVRHAPFHRMVDLHAHAPRAAVL